MGIINKNVPIKNLKDILLSALILVCLGGCVPVEKVPGWR